MAECLQKLSDPARRSALRENRPWITLNAIEKIVVAETFCEATRPSINETIGDIAERLGKDVAPLFQRGAPAAIGMCW